MAKRHYSVKDLEEITGLAPHAINWRARQLGLCRYDRSRQRIFTLKEKNAVVGYADVERRGRPKGTTKMEKWLNVD